MHPKWHFLLRIRSSSSSDENDMFYAADNQNDNKNASNHIDRKWTCSRKRKAAVIPKQPSLSSFLLLQKQVKQSSHDDHHQQQQEHHHVTFDRVFVREYKRMVGNHPNLEYPLGLDWMYMEFPAVPVDVHEQHQQHHRHHHLYSQSPSTSQSSVGGGGGGRATATWAKYYQPVDNISGRIHLLQHSCTMDQIRRGERQRRIQLVKEWAYSCNKEDGKQESCPATTLCDEACPHAAALFKHYIL